MYKRVLLTRGLFRWKVSVLNSADVNIFTVWFLSRKRAKQTATSLSLYYDCRVEGDI